VRLRRHASAAPPEVAELGEKVRRARARNRALRRRLDKTTSRLESQRAELARLREWSLDVFPDRPVPDRLTAAAGAIRDEGLTFLTPDQLRSLISCVLEVEEAGREGILIEAGTARGGSAIAMALAKSPERELRVYDVFGMIPAPSDRDGADVVRRYETIASGKASTRDGSVYYGYREDLLGEVRESFARHHVPVEENRVSLVEGLFQDTVTGDEPVALAHLDGDWYDSTMTCLERIAPRLVVGGRLVIDDYYSWSGCRRAVDDYFADRPGYRVEFRAKVHVVRTAPSTVGH
jgi:hypothetical protein